MKPKTSLSSRFGALTAMVAVTLVGPILATTGAGKRDFYFPSTGVRAEGRALLLAIDDQLLPLRDNVDPRLFAVTLQAN